MLFACMVFKYFVISVFSSQQLDYPVCAGSKGTLKFLNHVTDEMQQVYRERIFRVHTQDLVDVTARFVILYCVQISGLSSA